CWSIGESGVIVTMPDSRRGPGGSAEDLSDATSGLAHAARHPAIKRAKIDRFKTASEIFHADALRGGERPRAAASCNASQMNVRGTRSKGLSEALGDVATRAALEVKLKPWPSCLLLQSAAPQRQRLQWNHTEKPSVKSHPQSHGSDDRCGMLRTAARLRYNGDGGFL